MIPENIHTSPTEGIFSKTPPPLWKFQLYFMHFFKFLALQNAPLPRKFQFLLWGEYGYFLELHNVADTLLPTQMFPCLPVCTAFVADTNFVSGTQKMFLILFRNILCPQQMFPKNPRNIMGNNVLATMCPRLAGP